MRRSVAHLIAIGMVILLVSCSSDEDDRTARDRSPNSRPGASGPARSAPVVTGDGKGPLGTGTIPLARVNNPSKEFCDGMKEFDQKYGPYTKPKFTPAQIGDVVVIFRRMEQTAPDEVKPHFDKFLPVADQIVAAQKSGAITDEASAARWVEQNLGPEKAQALFAEAASIIAFAASSCKLPLPKG